jgi:AraC-like DNA-binding protein
MKVIDNVIEVVKQNYDKNITAKDGAKKANLSYAYFSRVFNSVMGMGFSEYLTFVRIVKSEQLLVDTDKSITEIGYECGFSTSSYFIMKFKEKNGIPPLGFRKKFKV